MEEKPRIIVYSIIGGFIAGLVYNIVIIANGLLMDPPDMLGMFKTLGSMMGDIFGVTDPMMLAIFGFMFHTIGSTIVLGGLYGVTVILLQSFLTWEVYDTLKTISFGVIWGIVIWVVGPVMMVPMLMPDVPSPLVDMFSIVTILGFVGHIIFGALIGAVVWFLDDRYYLI